MLDFNEITRWSNLARIAGGNAAKLTIAAPFAAFIILHNEPLQPFLEMSENWHPNPFIESLALARFDIFYVGLVVIGIAVAMFSLFSPSQISSYNSYDEFLVVKESIKTDNGVEGSLRLTLEEYSKYATSMSLEVDVRERRFRFPRRFREGLWRLLVALSRSDAEKTGENENGPKDILAGLIDVDTGRSPWWERVHHLLPLLSRDVFRLEYIRADYGSPLLRTVVFWIMMLGIFIVFIPTLITTYLVLSDLVRVVEDAPGFDTSVVRPR